MKVRAASLTVSVAVLILSAGCDQSPTPIPAAQPSPAASQLPALTGLVPATGPALTASPNPVPPGTGGTGTTVIGWNTGDRVGEIYLVAGNTERLFARGDKGAQSAPWITAGSTTFRLYRGTDHRELLKDVIVTMSGGVSAPTAAAASATP